MKVSRKNCQTRIKFTDEELRLFKKFLYRSSRPDVLGVVSAEELEPVWQVLLEMTRELMHLDNRLIDSMVDK